jgi:NADPH-dependent 7-cyano-7-deazaguanine reductase QueF
VDKLFSKIQALNLEYTDKPQPELLVAMPNPYPDQDYEVQVVSPEFTALCPVNPGQPDFATVTIKYVPDKPATGQSRFSTKLLQTAS